VEITPTTKVEQSKLLPLEVKPHTELMEEEVKIIDSKVGTKPLVVQVETSETIVEQLEAEKVAQCFHFIFYHFIRIASMKSKVQRG